MSKTNAKILLSLLAVALLFGAYMYIFKGNMEDKDALDSDIESLEVRYNDLRAKELNRTTYENELKLYSEETLNIVNEYPVYFDEVDIIMLVKKFIDDNTEGNIQIDNISMNAPVDYYTIGGVMDETGSFNEGYTCYSVSLPVNFVEATYDGVKNFIDYIQNNTTYKMSVSSTSLNPDDLENDSYSGTMDITLYCITGPGREKVDIPVDDTINHGVDNVFIGGTNANSVVVYAHDYDNGESIKAKNDFSIILNNANNDVADGIVVSAGTDDSVVSDSSNDVVKVNVAVTGKEGAYEYSYSIGSKTYKGKLAEDAKELAIYVSSNDRVDDADKNGVELVIKNSTEIPVFVKVAGDDATSPRFTVGDKEGTVKVY